jgi:inhibitor of KinA sporulation pathway (predicted exonuclease)
MARAGSARYLLVIAIEAKRRESVTLAGVLVDAASFDEVAEFSSPVRSVRGSEADTPVFPLGLRALRERLVEGRERLVLGSWERRTFDQLERDCERHAVPSLMLERVDLSAAFARKQGLLRTAGISQALSLCGLPRVVGPTRALADARNAARLLSWIFGRRCIGDWRHADAAR